VRARALWRRRHCDQRTIWITAYGTPLVRRVNRRWISPRERGINWPPGRQARSAAASAARKACASITSTVQRHQEVKRRTWCYRPPTSPKPPPNPPPPSSPRPSPPPPRSPRPEIPHSRKPTAGHRCGVPVPAQGRRRHVRPHQRQQDDPQHRVSGPRAVDVHARRRTAPVTVGNLPQGRSPEPAETTQRHRK
jgi:U5 snRNP spliceosome subunit